MRNQLKTHFKHPSYGRTALDIPTWCGVLWGRVVASGEMPTCKKCLERLRKMEAACAAKLNVKKTGARVKK